MPASRHWISLLGFLPALASPGAFASGAITSLSITPYPATAGQEISVKVEGTGTCAAHVTFGDDHGSFLGPLTLPATLKHTYAKAGQYVVRAAPAAREGGEAQKGQPPVCTGSDDVPLTVKAGTGKKAARKAAPMKKITLADGRVLLHDEQTGAVRIGAGANGQKPPAGGNVPDGIYRTAAGREVFVRGGRLLSLSGPTPKAKTPTPEPGK